MTILELEKNLWEKVDNVVRCGYSEDMNTATISLNNINYTIVQIKDHGDNFKAQLGWTHFAEVKRINGRRTYFANLLIVDGEIMDSKVIN